MASPYPEVNPEISDLPALQPALDADLPQNAPAPLFAPAPIVPVAGSSNTKKNDQFYKFWDRFTSKYAPKTSKGPILDLDKPGEQVRSPTKARHRDKSPAPPIDIRTTGDGDHATTTVPTTLDEDVEGHSTKEAVWNKEGSKSRQV